MRAGELAVPPDRVMLDTNVLLAATDEGRTEHPDALNVLNEWPGGGAELCTTGQILREYLAVASRPVRVNGLGLAPPQATRNVRAFRERFVLVSEDCKVADRLLSLLDDTGCGGKQVHDANVVAAMLAHGIGTLVTMNLADFARFDAFVTLIGL